MTGDPAVAVVQQIMDDPMILGLGDLGVARLLPSDWSGQAGLLLQGDSVFYVVDLQLGPADDRQLIRLIERWSAVRWPHASQRGFAVLVAEQVEPRYGNILGVIGRAVPVLAMEMDFTDGRARFTHLLPNASQLATEADEDSE